MTSTYTYRFGIVILAIILVLSAGCGAVTPIARTITPTITLTPVPSDTPSPTPAPTKTVTPTPTPAVSSDAEPLAWMDSSIRLDKLSPNGQLMIHFNTPMLTESSASPVLAWPALQGKTQWNDEKTTLTFTAQSNLDVQTAYTFFLNPELHAASGKMLKDAPSWIAHAQPAPAIIGVNPSVGEIARSSKTMYVTFDQDMNPTLPSDAITIQPSVKFSTNWATRSSLEIKIDDILTPGQRYDLTLAGLSSVDGAKMEEPYRWFYNITGFTATFSNQNAKTLKLEFNSKVDTEKTGLPFVITPALNGTWQWTSTTTATFTATERIPATQNFTLSFDHPFTNPYDTQLLTLPPQSFTGLFPIEINNLEASYYDNGFSLNASATEIAVTFKVPVDHKSAEHAFSLQPPVAGTFSWAIDEKSEQDILTYKLDQLLIPGKHKLRIDNTVLDNTGKKMIANPYEQSFSVSQYSSLSPSFGEGGESAQVVDASGSRRIQIQGSAAEINFSAYGFELVDYAQLYANYYPQYSNSYYRNLRNIPIPSGQKPSAHWTETTTRKMGDSTVEETRLPQELAPGLYILNMNVGNVLYDQLFVILSHNTLVVKWGDEDLSTWVTDINGAAMPNAEVRVYNQRGEKIREGKTNADGLYKTEVPFDADLMLVSARTQQKGQPEDVTLSGFSGWYTYGNSYDNNSRYDSSLRDGQPYNIYTYTERPIYRPGQTVNFKSIIRRDHDMRYEMPREGTDVTVRLEDSRGNLVKEQTLKTNRFGSINGAFTLSEGAMLGKYFIETAIDDISSELSFSVEEYRKPDYSITITPLQPEKNNQYIRNEDVQVKVNVAYYFGEPVANARFNVDFYQHGSISGVYTSGDSTTDQDGNAIFSFPAPYHKSENYYYYDDSASDSASISISVDDGSEQKVSSEYAFQVFPAAEKLQLHTDDYFVEPNTPVTVSASATDLLDNPTPNQPMKLEIFSWSKTTYKYDQLEQTFSLESDTQGKASQTLKLNKGYYQLTLSSKDTKGNEVTVKYWLYVFHDRNDWWHENKDQPLAITTDKDSYKPYEKARIAIESSFSGPAWLTFERGSVINSKPIQLTAPMTLIETDIIPEYVSDVYIVVNAWQPTNDKMFKGDMFETISDSHLYTVQKRINVDANEKALNIQIQTDKQTYAPGDQVNTTIDVHDAEGKPVVAELSLAVVDESIFALANDNTDPIFDAFYGPRSHNVYTYDSMEPSRYIIGGRGGGGDVGPSVSIRSNFPDTSAWLPVIQTDANGKATVPFTLPDNTTSWRLTVKAISLNHRVGQAISNIQTKKEVFLRTSFPRMVVEGDDVTLMSFVHNYTATAQNLVVQFSADGLKVLGPETNQRQITVKAGAVELVGWHVHVDTSKPTDVTLTVVGVNGPLDSIRVPLQAQPHAIADLQNQSGQFSGQLTLALPLPLIERQSSSVRLSLSRSMSGTLLNGLEYLTGYPYGCVEQTMSRALPNAVVSRAAKQLGIGGPDMQTRLNPLIDAGIQKLYGMQHNDGGWGWWADDSTDAYETAWVLFGLGIMDQSGHQISPQVMDEAAKWLKNYFTDTNGYYRPQGEDVDPRTEAYALFSMAEAGRGEKELTLALAQSSAQQLDPFSQAALALALDQLGEKEQAKNLMALLTQEATQQGNNIYWLQPSYDGEYHQKTMSSTTRTTALVLLAYMRIEPESQLIPSIVAYLASKRQGMQGWGTTNETSFTILALTEYLKAQQNQAGDSHYTVSANGESLFDGNLTADQSNINLDIPISTLNDGLNTLTLTAPGDHTIFYDLSTSYDLLQTDPSAAGPLQITRTYYDATSDTELDLNHIKAGQLIKVEVNVHAEKGLSYVAVEDHLPGGLEALNEKLNTVIAPMRYYGYTGDYWNYEDVTHYYWSDYGYNYKEIRDAQVTFFITNFEKGFHRFEYYARATSTGKFTALPAKAYAMYDAHAWGRSIPLQMVVK